MQKLWISVRSLAALMLILALGASAAWGEDAIGAQPFLRMGVGARALGMGGAFVAVADDATAGYWNPAALPRVEHIDIMGMYSAGMELDRTLNYIAYAQTFGTMALGVSWLNAGVKDIEHRSMTDELLGQMDWSSNAFLVSLGVDFMGLAAGGSVKFLNHDNMGESDNGVGFDAGVLFHPTPMLAIGAVLQDFGSEIDNDKIPHNIRVGIAAMPFGTPSLIIAGDLEKTKDRSDTIFHLGGEFKADVAQDVCMALRAGFRDSAFSAGAGISMQMARFDYAYVTEYTDDDASFLGESHRLSIGFSF